MGCRGRPDQRNRKTNALRKTLTLNNMRVLCAIMPPYAPGMRGDDLSFFGSYQWLMLNS
jgi:hypothetical protein